MITTKFNKTRIYIITLDSSINTKEYMEKVYFNYLYPSYKYIKNEETGKKERICTNKLHIYDDSLKFNSNSGQFGKTIHTFKEKLEFCIVEFGNNTPSELKKVSTAYKNVIKNNLSKYDIKDVENGFDLPIDIYHENTTGKQIPYLGNIDKSVHGILTKWLKDNNISIEEFLENPQYVIFLDSEYTKIMETLKKFDMISNKVENIF